jgi:valyl-tRNA synthetase
MIALNYTEQPGLSGIWKTGGADFILQKLANATSNMGATDGISFLAGKYQYHTVLSIKVDKEAELSRMKEELAYYQGFVSSVEKKLSNDKFVANAKAEVVENEKKKKADGEAKIAQLLQSIANLN